MTSSPDSRRIAGLLGPTCLAMATTEALNLHTLANPPAAVGLVYLNGTLLFVAGLAVVRAHNRWQIGWPVLVTLLGWMRLLAGLLRMLAPASTSEGGWVDGLLIAMLVIGLVLTIQAYGRATSG